MDAIRKGFSLEKRKIISAMVGSLLLAATSVIVVNASDSNMENGYDDIYVNVEFHITDEKETLNEINPAITKLIPENLVSHAGGRVKGKSYTNSIESIDRSYENGYRFIELDFEWTIDGNLALIHDWGGYVNSAFGVESKMYSSEEFKSFSMIEGLNQMILDDLADWLYGHEDVYIVTDIKTCNIEALKLIRDRYPDLTAQFIPQIYKIDEFIPVQELGYTNVILTLYMSNYSDDELLDFVKDHQIFAVTMPISRARTELPSKLKIENVFVYAHTINNHGIRQELELYGVDGFYTDDILPSSWGIAQIEKAREYNLVTDNIIENLQQDITREELCELIVRLYEAMSGEEAIAPVTNRFMDTSNLEILKANALGIVNGVDETQFSPNTKVTREEIAAMLYRTLRTVDESLIEGNCDVSFADKGDISNWALEAVGFMNNYGILSGVGDNRVSPKSNVTREEGIILVKGTFEKFRLN
ncbi:S-layer homology domain-containing protein [Proteiniborus sp. MB09-C3]|uniref:S-layer homology domain-containing protein n=1 Tax=Proteiniborus sp. MB09-C3 TaxID=3050072 RepID=UPI002554E8A7|nr:S-layer homology domain-containing protein [Proteiniborus sp. MB09-C3]WIV12239.1 S-layer homology domain-containing protein [Proteiniborus sp. MB09-C3]